MSDRPDESRPTSEVAGGWFVPKNAMNEQQIAATSAQAADQPADSVPMPDNSSPERKGEWYVPSEAQARAAALTENKGGDGGPAPAPKTDQQAQPAQQPAQQAASAIPAGAALSDQVDYSNYVPGKGFVAKSEAASPADTSAAPVEEPAMQAGPQLAAPGPIAVPAPQPASQAAPAAVETQNPPQAPTGAQAAVPKPVNPELAQRYNDVEQAVQVLRRRYAAGTITRDQLQAELRKLMILDEEGYWWMIGLESDRWYRYNGKDWVPATPAGRMSDGAAGRTPAPAAAAPSSPALKVGASTESSATAAEAGAAPEQQADTEANRFDIPLDEYGMPLPQRVPINDPGATMVGAAAPRLDSTLKGEPTTRPGGSRFFERASQQGGVAPYDAGVTVPSAALQVTQPGAAASAGAARAPARAAVAAPAVEAPSVPSPRVKPAFQPDYGARPTSWIADRQRRAGCLIRLAILSVFGVLALSIIGIVALVLGYFSIIQQYDANITALPQVVHSVPQSVRILDSKGRVLAQLNDPNTGMRIYVPLDQISQNMIAATIRVENKRFYEDPGFDVVGIVRAILQNLRAGEGVTGASSITQQLTRMFVLDPGAAQDRSTRRKITEIIVASEIARRYSKSDILEWYLNSVNYGNLAYGVEAAAKNYFGISAKDLNLAQGAFLAGLVQAPFTYDPVQHRDAAMGRFEDVWAIMPELGCIQMENPPYNQAPFCVDQSTVNANVVTRAQVQATTFRPPQTNAIYPHFVKYVYDDLTAKFGADTIYRSGFSVYTTIDPTIQDAAQTAVQNQLARLRNQNVTNAAVLAIRPSDGAILAMVGSVDFNNKAIGGEFNVTLAARQPGSSIKPFVYALALERDPSGNYWTPATIIWDVPSCFGTNRYCPENYDRKYHGPQSVRNALGNSLNIPAVKTMQFVGVDRFKQAALSRFGLEFPGTQPEQAGLATVLGAAEVPMFDMVHGYSIFANNGNLVDTYAIAKVTRRNGNAEEPVFVATDHPLRKVMEPGIAYLITSILSDNNARALEFGLNSPLRLDRPAAAKTGTTSNFKDNWTIGYTPQIVVGVWVGNNNNTPMVGSSGITGAAPIWHDVMTAALAGQPAQQFQPPANDQQMRVCADFGTQDFQDCPTHASDWFFSANPPSAPTNLFKSMQIDSFSGLIANENCPDYVQNKTFLIVDDPTAIAWLNNDPNGQAWAQQHHIDLPVVPPPTQACDPNTPRPILKLTSPQPQTTVQGLLEVRGSVFVPGFNRYQLEVAQGLNGTDFHIVDGPITAQPSADNSFLGRWDTTGISNGPYTLRLWAVDGQGHHAEITLPVNVNNVAPTPIVPQPGQPTPVTQPGQQQPVQPQPGLATATPIIINSNPPTPTVRLIFPPTATPGPQ